MDVSDHTVVPPAGDQLRCPFVQQPGDLTGKVCFTASIVGEYVEDCKGCFVNLQRRPEQCAWFGFSDDGTSCGQQGCQFRPSAGCCFERDVRGCRGRVEICADADVVIKAKAASVLRICAFMVASRLRGRCVWFRCTLFPCRMPQAPIPNFYSLIDICYGEPHGGK